MESFITCETFETSTAMSISHMWDFAWKVLRVETWQITEIVPASQKLNAMYLQVPANCHTKIYTELL